MLNEKECKINHFKSLQFQIVEICQNLSTNIFDIFLNDTAKEMIYNKVLLHMLHQIFLNLHHFLHLYTITNSISISWKHIQDTKLSILMCLSKIEKQILFLLNYNYLFIIFLYIL